jgi:putative redox protein
MSYTATAQPINGTLRNEIDVNGRHTIITDEPARLGGTDTAPTPHELLAATLASCVSTMLVLYAKPRDIDLGDLRVDVDYDADPTPKRVEVTIHLPDHLTDDQIKRLEKVAETCPVRRALEAGFTFDERLVTTRSPTRVGHVDLPGTAVRTATPPSCAPRPVADATTGLGGP